jgi:hypothetical protein
VASAAGITTIAILATLIVYAVRRRRVKKASCYSDLEISAEEATATPPSKVYAADGDHYGPEAIRVDTPSERRESYGYSPDHNAEDNDRGSVYSRASSHEASGLPPMNVYGSWSSYPGSTLPEYVGRLQSPPDYWDASRSQRRETSSDVAVENEVRTADDEFGTGQSGETEKQGL